MNSLIEKKGYQVLVESGKAPKEILEQTYQRAETSEYTFSKLLVREGILKEGEILQIYSQHFGIPFVQLKNIQVDKSLIEKIPVKFAWYYKFFPVALRDRKLTLAVSRLIDIRILDEMRFGLGFEIELNFALETEVEEMSKRFYGVGSDTIERMLAQTAGAPAPITALAQEEVQDIEKLAETASVVQLVNQIIFEAYKKRASDIHFEPLHGKVRLRYRIDGILQEAPVPAEMNKFFNAILSRIKIMANLNIVERRLPQDGKARVKVQQAMIDLRVSSIPTPYGESMVVRILPNQRIITLDQLGFEPEQLKIFQELLKHPHGIIFVTGPTGSGKSTTLNAALSVMNVPMRKIITIEDPVEYDMEGVTQIQVQPEIGLTFAQGLRSVLRHDPDVMMVGEVRDLETADTAIRVALTGHLILSTLHTNDSASGVTRLLDIGVEPYLVASSVIAFTAQRLVRTVCKHCKTTDENVLPEIQEMIRQDLGLSADAKIPVYYGKGCDDCYGTGFYGRMAIHEILVVDEALRKLILSHASADEIRRHARQMGMATMREDGWRKVLGGLTVPDEIIRVTPSSEGIESLPESTALPFVEEKERPSFSRQRTQEEEILEKRKYTRVEVRFRVAFRLIDIDSQQQLEEKEGFGHEGVTQDLSAGGLAFLTHEPLEAGDILEIKIEIPDQGNPIQCISRVLRTEHILEKGISEKAKLWKAGVSFLAIHSHDRQRIENYCKGVASK